MYPSIPVISARINVFQGISCYRRNHTMEEPPVPTIENLSDLELVLVVKKPKN